jgi:uncharacterized membrane protein
MQFSHVPICHMGEDVCFPNSQRIRVNSIYMIWRRKLTYMAAIRDSSCATFSLADATLVAKFLSVSLILSSDYRILAFDDMLKNGIESRQRRRKYVVESDMVVLWLVAMMMVRRMN